MKKILKANFTVMAFILCAMFLLCGIEGINDETSYIISGERDDVIRVQSKNDDNLIISSPDKEDTPVVINADREKISGVLNGAKYVLFPPLGNIIFIFDYISENF